MDSCPVLGVKQTLRFAANPTSRALAFIGDLPVASPLLADEETLSPSMPLTTFVATASPVFSQQGPPPSERAKQVEALVTKAAVLVDNKGKAAFEDFRKKESEWFHGDTYLFVYDMIAPSRTIRWLTSCVALYRPRPLGTAGGHFEAGAALGNQSCANPIFRSQRRTN
jgi:hypothetical protein